MRANMPPTGHRQVNEKPFKIAINSRESAPFYPLDLQKTANFLDAILRQTPVLLRGILKALLRLRAARIVNWIVARLARKSPVVQWGIQQGMHVTGTSSAFEFFQRSKQFQTADVSASIRQDVLLLAGSEDHYVPMEQWQHQIRMLKNGRSLTARLFTLS